MKTMYKTLFLMFICYSLTACEGGWPSSYTYDCIWYNNKKAVFQNSQLKLPCVQQGSSNYFENQQLGNVLNTWSLYNLMETIQQGVWNIGSSFDFKWKVTLASGITCSPYTDNYRMVSFNQDNYTQYFTSYGEDILEGSPYIQDGNYILPYDHLHELTFQIHDVENVYTHQFGTMTWNRKWPNPTNPGAEFWFFDFPYEGVIGKFVPNPNYIISRNIYINGQFVEIPYIQ